MYPFADIDLARRLERTEARGNVEFVEARARAFPGSRRDVDRSGGHVCDV